MNTWAFLFDLDQTLVLTSKIEKMRQKREWSKIYYSFNKTNLPPGTHQFLLDISQIGQMGVVTLSPKSYAEKLLAYHQINIPIIVAYHDVKHIKPNPECILMATEKMQVPLKRCIYIGDRTDDILCAEAAGIISLGINWDGLSEIDENNTTAYAVCHNWNGIYKAISKIIS
jgi:HAD superfamily hydrolase (TIGR01549 family)